MIRIDMPDGAREIIDTLLNSGFKAYVVGGCVRDSMVGRRPKDWDICTSATPSEIIRCFEDKRIIETGVRHGTVTVESVDGMYEVTTFRIDGFYSDNRHPDDVCFVRSLIHDLERRDFTISAMAYNENDGLIDLFNGIEDLESGIISCVGNPDDRFKEDGLRIMRALRFASVYGFSISDSTSSAIHRNVDLLDNIARERICSELCKILNGSGVLNILLDYSDVFSKIIPELHPCIGFEQNNRFHKYTVYDHMAHAVSNYHGSDTTVRLALLLHDIGKPLCYTEDVNGGHFYGHSKPGSQIAEQALCRLRFNKRTVSDVVSLIAAHDADIAPTQRTVRKWLNKLGECQFYRLIDMKMSDMLSHADGTQDQRIDRLCRVSIIANSIIANKQCFSIKDLCINGYDIMSLGVSEGVEVGRLLNISLSAVIDGLVKNEKSDLMNYIKGNI